VNVFCIFGFGVSESASLPLAWLFYLITENNIFGIKGFVVVVVTENNKTKTSLPIACFQSAIDSDALPFLLLKFYFFQLLLDTIISGPNKSLTWWFCTIMLTPLKIWFKLSQVGSSQHSKIDLCLDQEVPFLCYPISCK
jgi:hypothetical protein